MKRQSNLSIDLFGDRLDLNPKKNEEDDGDYRRMLCTLRRAVEGELTERQRECVQMCYFEGKSGREAANALGVTPPTVSKHLKKARARLGRVIGYSFSRLN